MITPKRQVASILWDKNYRREKISHEFKGLSPEIIRRFSMPPFPQSIGSILHRGPLL